MCADGVSADEYPNEIYSIWENCPFVAVCTFKVNVMRAEIRTLGLPYTSDDTQQWKMVVETKLENSRRLIILRSAVQVHHSFAFGG